MKAIVEIKKCGECGQEIYIERLVNGSNHTLATAITCKECLKVMLDEGRITNNEEEIREWLEG